MVVGGWPWQMCGWWGRAERLGNENADGRIKQVITPNESVGRRAILVGYFSYTVWPLTLKFDRATRLFLKFDMRHVAYRHATGLSKR